MDSGRKGRKGRRGKAEKVNEKEKGKEKGRKEGRDGDPPKTKGDHTENNAMYFSFVMLSFSTPFFVVRVHVFCPSLPLPLPLPCPFPSYISCLIDYSIFSHDV